jgi:hypothetical protein
MASAMRAALAGVWSLNRVIAKSWRKKRHEGHRLLRLCVLTTACWFMASTTGLAASERNLARGKTLYESIVWPAMDRRGGATEQRSLILLWQI